MRSYVTGTYGDSKGWFIHPTVIRCDSPTMSPWFGRSSVPFSIYVYEDSQLDETLRICDTASPTRSPAQCSPRTVKPS